MTDESLENEEIEPTPEVSPRTRPQPFAADQEYQDLLTHFQNGDWVECDRLIGILLASYPGDPGLLEFQSEVRVKQALQKSDQAAEKESRRSSLVKILLYAGVGVVIVGAIVTAFLVSMNRVQTRIATDQATQEAENLLRTLSTKLENAEDLIRSGRPSAALDILQDIQEVDPNYEGLDAALEDAETMVAMDELYLEANQFYTDGLLYEALTAFQEIERKSPAYRDTRLRIQQVEQDIEVNRLMDSISVSFEEQDWTAVVEAYETITTLNPSANIEGLEEMLFTAYMNLIIGIADKIDSTIEDIDKAQDYYKSALALFPQNKEFAGERKELQDLATRLIANNYYIFAKNLLDTEGYGPDTMREVLRLLNQSNNIGGGSPAITQEIERGGLYLSGFDNLANGNFDTAIEDLGLLYRQDPVYGDGILEYLLFEAYLARGDALFTYADYPAARDDYQQAETFIWGDEANTLRLFEIQVRIGQILRRLSFFEQAAEYYNYSLNQVDFHTRVRTLGTVEQIQIYEEARVALAAKNQWGTAVTLFETVLEDVSVIYTYDTAEVSRGQSVYMIAYYSGSTVGLIQEANDLGLISVFKYDQQIQIPLYVEGAE